MGAGIRFGPQLIAGAALMLPNTQKTAETSNINKSSFVAPPVLDPLPQATNSAKTNVSGKTFSKQLVFLYVNNNRVDETSADENGNFLFEEVPLDKGENLILAKTKNKEDKESDFSDEQTIIVRTDKPELSIDSPTDGQSFSKADKTIIVKGKTNIGNKVTVNDFWAIVDDNGQYSYNLTLQDGENSVKIVSTDQAGNTEEKTIKVTYSP